MLSFLEEVRTCLYRIKNCRDATFLSKQGVDSFNLQLQNLLYEVLHLKKEVTKCVNFKVNLSL